MTAGREAGRASGRTIALIALVVVNLILVVLNLQKQELFPFDSGQASIAQSID